VAEQAALEKDIASLKEDIKAIEDGKVDRLAAACLHASVLKTV
jgi:hypothetical protein